MVKGQPFDLEETMDLIKEIVSKRRIPDLG